MWSWGIKFLACCNKKKALESSTNMMRLAIYSKEMLKEIEADTDFSYDKGSEGILHIFKSDKDLRNNIEQAKFLKKLGCDYQLLDSRLACEEKEPAFKNSPMNIIGGIHYPMDEKGDIFKFTTQLSDKLQKSGSVEFRYNTDITDINLKNNKIISVSTDKGELEADSYVMCLGVASPIILDKVGIKVPIYPMKGYSISIPIKNYDEAPSIGVTDQSNKIVYSKLGNILRVAGTAEFAGYDDSIQEKRINTLKKMTKELFPNCGDLDNSTSWSCLRPSTPDGSPIIGRCAINNLYINTGHGTLGWTMSFASSKAISDIIAGKEPAIDLTGLDMRRFT
jgi:D-amino-acid dehydrogenase